MIFIGSVVGAAIGWNWNHLTSKGKFTRLDINDDGTVLLEFDYKKRFGKIGNNATEEITKELKEAFKGAVEVTTIQNESNKLMIVFKLKKEKDDERFILLLEEQEECLTNLCRNYL